MKKNKLIPRFLVAILFIPQLTLAFIIALILFLLEMTVLLIYDSSIKWKNEMVMKASEWFNDLK